jgi:hypothetical protein
MNETTSLGAILRKFQEQEWPSDVKSDCLVKLLFTFDTACAVYYYLEL